MTNITATFRFYAELNDFLPIDRRKVSFSHSFAPKTSVKDIVESFGVPHTEIDLILANGKSVDFNYQVGEHDQISVYPTFESFDIKPITHLRPEPLRDTRFILDVHLGKLARYLRLLGFDTRYQTDYEDKVIINHALEDKRIILTRDIGLLKNKKVTHGYWLRETNPKLQVKEILMRFDLKRNVHPFTRCLECNSKLSMLDDRDLVRERGVPRMVYATQTQFNECSNCKRIYWRGSHYQKLTKVIEEVLGTH